MKIIQEDKRFIHFTNCNIIGFFMKIPKQFGGYKIDISFKDDDNDFFYQYFSIEIDQNSLEKDLIELKSDSAKRFQYTNGMIDIDIYMMKDQYVIYYSINDGSYFYFFFSKNKFDKLFSWCELNND